MLKPAFSNAFIASRWLTPGIFSAWLGRDLNLTNF
jgi:hypothetical protein